MGDLGCVPEVRQSRLGVKTGLPGQRLPLLRQMDQKMVQVRQSRPWYKNGAPRLEAPPVAPKWTKKQQVRQNPRAPQRIKMGCNRGLRALKRVKKAFGPSAPEPPLSILLTTIIMLSQQFQSVRNSSRQKCIQRQPQLC